MNATILDSRDEAVGRCFLCSITLEEYVRGLPSTYQDYEIQREIVSNVYLDHLVETVLGRRHIPPIVLVAEEGDVEKKGKELHIKEFRILDGLQRTFRLQAIRETIRYGLDKVRDESELLAWNKFKFSRTFSADLRELNSNTEVFRAVLEGMQTLGRKRLLESYTDNRQWFEIWTGLSAAEEVRKMLTLNAGHKPVKTRHQLELLFLNLLPVLKSDEGDGFQLVREKEVSSTQFSKSRNAGSFHFAHIVTSLLSFQAAKPIAASTGLIQDIQSDDKGLDEFSGFISPELLKEFVAFLVRADRLLAKQYGNAGILWMGREVSLAGLFGALGAIAKNSGEDRVKTLRRLTDLLKAHPQVLNLTDFEEVRNSVDLSKVNIGNVNRVAVFTAIKDLLASQRPTKISWRMYFGTADK